jgi:hypothetical protein
MTRKMAEGSLPLGPSEITVKHMLATMTKERDEVIETVRREVEKLLRWGAETSGMTYICTSSNTTRPCLRPRNMRSSYLQDDGPLNVKRIHWIFHELPDTLHKDVLMHRMSHMDVVAATVMRQLNVVWGEIRVGEEGRRSNCIEKVYCRILNEKKTTIVKAERTKNRRTPFVRHPQRRADSGNPAAYRQGKAEFYWKSPGEGEHVVKWSLVGYWGVADHVKLYLTVLFTFWAFMHTQVDYQSDLEWNQWNIAAKKRILLDDGNNLQNQVHQPPRAPYYVSKRPGSTCGTLVSSIGSRGCSNIATEVMTPGNEEDNMEPADTQNWDDGNLDVRAHVHRGNGGVPAVSIDPETGDIPQEEEIQERQAQSEREVSNKITG